MMRILMALVLWGAGAMAAMACPSIEKPGMGLNFTGDQLFSPQSFQTMATGGYAVEPCGVGGTGVASIAPQFSLNLTGMAAYDLEIQVVSQCDATLLVNTADGFWLFDDDGNGNLDPALTIRGQTALEGRVDVWVGTLGGNCPATIEFETWTASSGPMGGGSGGANCPTTGLTGPSFNLTGNGLYTPQSFSASAYGSTDITTCGLPVNGSGYFTPAPQYSLYLSQMQGYRLELQVTSGCDAAMLVNTADGQWFFDDDSNGNLDPLINIAGLSALEGRVDVWLGTFDGSSCPANLELETWTQ